MKRQLLLIALMVLPLTGRSATPLGTASNPPVVQTAAATFTIQTGVTTTFAAGSTVNFNGTVNGLSTASDTAFGSSWNAVTTIPPSKNAIYDFLHIFDTDDDGKVNVLDLAAGIPKTDSSGVLSLSANLGAIDGLTSAADRLPYFTGSGTASLATFTAFARTFLDDAAVYDARATLGLIPSSAGAVIHVSKSTTATDTRTSLSDYDPAVPFATLGAAQTAADSGDLIVVSPGTYDTTGTRLGKTGVNWYLPLGTTITSTDSSVPVFGDNSTAMTFKVWGRGRILINEAGDEGAYAILLLHASSSVVFECDEVYGNALSLIYSNGSLTYRARNTQGTGTAGGAIELSGSGTNNIYSESVLSSDSSAFQITGGTNHIKFNTVTTPGAGTEGFSVGGGTTDVWQGIIDSGAGEAVNHSGGTLRFHQTRLTTSSTTGTVRTSGATAGTIDLDGCYIESTHATMNPIDYLSSPSNKTLILRNCEVKAAAGATYGINSGNAQTVTVVGSLKNNKANHANITLSYANTYVGGDGSALTNVTADQTYILLNSVDDTFSIRVDSDQILQFNNFTSVNFASGKAALFNTGLGLGALATVTPGTGIATALGVNIGSAGAPVLFNGAGGTPSSLAGTNITALNATQLTSGTVPVARLSLTLAELNTAVSDANIARVDAGNTFVGAQVITAINGGTAANDDLRLQGTTDSTRTTSYLTLQENGGFVGIGTPSPAYFLELHSYSASVNLALSNDGVAHGITTRVATNVFGVIQQNGAAIGGLNIEGFTDTSGEHPLSFIGTHGAASPSDATVHIRGQKKNGTGTQALAVAENVLTINNYTTTLITVPGGGGIAIKASAAEPTPPSDTTVLYSIGDPAEGYWADEGGNESLQTPHGKDAPAWMYDEEPGIEHVTKMVQRFAGTVTFENLTRQGKLLELTSAEKDKLPIEKRRSVFTETIEEHNKRTGSKRTVLKWEDVQESHRKERDQQISAWTERKKVADKAMTDFNKIKSAEDKAKVGMPEQFTEPKPEPYKKKDMPTHLKARLAKPVR